MGSIEIPYLTRNGKGGILRFDEDAGRIKINGSYTLLDLSALASNNSVKSIYLSSCPLKSLDITPVLHLKFEFLHLHSFLYTILSRKAVQEINPYFVSTGVLYDRCSCYYDEATIRRVLPAMMEHEEDTWKYPFFADNLMVTAKILGMGPIDVSADDVYRLVTENDISQRREMLISHYCSQIDGGGSTIYANLGLLVKEYGDLACRATEVVDLRTKEMESVIVKESYETNEVDLRNLWLTAYGFQILKHLDMGLWCSFEEFREIQSTLEELGYVIEIDQSSRSSDSSSMSSHFKEYIWTLAENPNLREMMWEKNHTPSFYILDFW